MLENMRTVDVINRIVGKGETLQEIKSNVGLAFDIGYDPVRHFFALNMPSQLHLHRFSGIYRAFDEILCILSLGE